MGLVAALQDAPQDKGLRMMVGFQMLKDGRAEDARNALRPVAFDPHGGDLAKAAADILAKLDAGGTKAALEGMKAPSDSEDPESS
jgi:hypothetical protein